MTIDLARAVRRSTLQMIAQANASHIGSCLSATDLLAVLYSRVVRIDPTRPLWSDRDRFILSKGHAVAALYAVLAHRGFFPLGWLDHYCENGSALLGHVSHHVPGVDWSSGSLGHGLSVGCGMALAAKRGHLDYRVFVLLSDGELDEGSSWEAILFAPHHRLDNLIAIVDYNKIQGFGSVKEVLDLSPMAEKWRAFNWAVREIDGHDHGQIADVLMAAPFEENRPSVIIAHTIKGKGVSFMEDQLVWHYKAPNDDQLREALAELEGET